MKPISTAPPLNQQQLRMTVCHARFPQVILIGDYKKTPLSAHFRHYRRKRETIEYDYFCKKNITQDARVYELCL